MDFDSDKYRDEDEDQHVSVPKTHKKELFMVEPAERLSLSFSLATFLCIVCSAFFGLFTSEVTLTIARIFVLFSAISATVGLILLVNLCAKKKRLDFNITFFCCVLAIVAAFI